MPFQSWGGTLTLAVNVTGDATVPRARSVPCTTVIPRFCPTRTSAPGPMSRMGCTLPQTMAFPTLTLPVTTIGLSEAAQTVLLQIAPDTLSAEAGREQRTHASATPITSHPN